MATILDGEQTGKLLGNLIYEKTQIHEVSVDLTVKSISRIKTGGSLDFGGSEFAPAERVVINSKKIDPADKYGWWSLAAGDYVVEHNEELSLHSEQVGFILPHERLLEAGATQSVRLVIPPGGRLISIVHVCQADVRIKENARISKLMIFQYG